MIDPRSLPWGWIGAGVAFVALAAIAGVWIAALKAEASLARADEAKATAALTRCTGRAAELERAYLTLAEASREQGASILAAREAAERAAADWQARAAAAEQRVRERLAAAQSVRAERAPSAADACAWARSRIDAELAAERGG